MDIRSLYLTRLRPAALRDGRAQGRTKEKGRCAREGDTGPMVRDGNES
jgi:hypothetical protein